MAASIDKIQIDLLNLATSKGYLTFDDILDVSESFNLSISELDAVSEYLNDRGILIYEESPKNYSDDSSSEDDDIDYSRVDYNEIYSRLLEYNPSLDMLISELKTIQAPQFGEVTKLIRQAREGNGFARERIILMYIRSALKIALSMTETYDFDIDDAISASIIGLMTGIDRYDPDGFSVFFSYVSMYIRQAIQRDCTPKWVEYYIPVHVMEKINIILSALNSGVRDFIIQLQLDKECMVYELSEVTELPLSDVSRFYDLIISQMEGKCSLEEIYEKIIGEDDPEVEEFFIDDEEQSFDRVITQISLRDDMKHSFEILSEREKEVIMLRYGFYDNRERTLDEIAGIFGLTRERIRQIEAKAFKRLKHIYVKKGLDAYL